MLTAPNMDLSTLLPANGGDGSLGVTLFGAEINDRSGAAVHVIGDLNGDGFDDVLIGAPSAGEAYLVFGDDDWSASPTLDLATLNGTNGFTFSGVDANFGSIGEAVSSAGDVNGDTFADLLLGGWRTGPGGQTQCGAG